jgi:hypothetical protein
MKDLKLLLLVIPVLVACTGPAKQAATQTATPRRPIATVLIGSAAPFSGSVSMGKIEGTMYWLTNDNSTRVPIRHVNLELNGHIDPNPRYTARTDQNGKYSFENLEPNNYGLGIYLNLPVGERLCEAPEYEYTQDLDWLHYATALRGDIWYDILFSSKDIVVDHGEIIFLDLALKCP